MQACYEKYELNYLEVVLVKMLDIILQSPTNTSYHLS